MMVSRCHGRFIILSFLTFLFLLSTLTLNPGPAAAQTAGNPFMPDYVQQEKSEAISKLRKGHFTLTLVDKKGAPLKNVEVRLRLLSHEFIFGGALFTPLFESDQPGVNNAAILGRADEMFNTVVDGNGFKWKAMEPVQGDVEYCISRHEKSTIWAHDHGKRVRHHCLFWSNPEQNPNWLLPLSNQGLEQAMTNRIKYCQENFGQDIRSLDVVNEMLYFHYYRGRLGTSIIPRIYAAARAAFPAARLYVNEFPPQQGKDFSCFNNYVNMIQQLQTNKVSYDGVGMQAHYNLADLRAAKIDLKTFMPQLDQATDRIAIAANRDVLYTEYDFSTLDEKLRADFLEAFYTYAFANPRVEGVLAWEWIDAEGSKSLVTLQGKLTEAGRRYESLVLDKWHDDITKRTDRKGNIEVDLFFGGYKITARGKTTTLDGQVNLSSTSSRTMVIKP